MHGRGRIWESILYILVGIGIACGLDDIKGCNVLMANTYSIYTITALALKDGAYLGVFRDDWHSNNGKSCTQYNKLSLLFVGERFNDSYGQERELRV
jgi:hypothetical protein